MKFNCGKPAPVRWAERRIYLSGWHVIFAWRPRRVGDWDCRWLELVERKGTFIHGYDDAYWEWEYRPHEPFYA